MEIIDDDQDDNHLEGTLNFKLHTMTIGSGLETIMEEDNFSPKYDSHNRS